MSSMNPRLTTGTSSHSQYSALNPGHNDSASRLQAESQSGGPEEGLNTRGGLSFHPSHLSPPYGKPFFPKYVRS